MKEENYIISKLYNELFQDVSYGDMEDKLEYMNLTYNLLENHPLFLELRNIKHHHYTNRLMHSLHVSYYCYCTCKKHNWDYSSAARGALLHDFFIVDKNIMRKREVNLLGFYHPRISMNNALSEFELNDIEKNCILRHMFPLTIIPAKYKEAWSVIFWDKVWGARELLKLQPSVLIPVPNYA